MKKIAILILVLIWAFCLLGQEAANPPTQETKATTQETKPQVNETKLGKIYFPKDFIHAGKDYAKGTYRVNLTTKEDVYFFQVLTPKKELLFEELAIIKPLEKKGKTGTFVVKKDLLKDQEYFRLKVITAEKLILAYFLVKK